MARPSVEVESSTIRSVTYDAKSRTLALQFQHGAVYLYFEVPPNIHRKLMAAASKGKYFNDFIKGKYRCNRASC